MLEPLREYLRERDLLASADALSSAGGVRRVLGALAESKVVTIYAGGEEPVYAIERGQHLVAAFYRNSAIHHFVDRAIAELVLLLAARAALGRGVAAARPAEVRVLLPRPRDLPRAALGAELGRLDPGWAEADGRAGAGPVAAA